MSIAFKHPEFLYLLSAVVIPIIIHLFSFRKYKSVYFHSIFLLKNIQQEQNKTRTKLKHLLILAARILTIISIVLAFAQPYIPNANYSQSQQRTHAVAIYIDTSFSSQAQSKQGTTLDYMITKARELVSSYSSTQQFYCITNTPNQLEQIQLTKEQIQNKLSEIKSSAFTKHISEVYASVQAIQKNIQLPVQLFLFSDFQKYATDFENILPDSTITIHIIPFEQSTNNNIYIDSCWFTTPYRMRSQPEELVVRIENNSNQTYNNLPVKLFINDSLKSIVPCSIEPFKKQDITVSFTINSPGIQALRIEIEDYPIVYDNTLYASYSIASQIPILLIHEQKPNQFLLNLYKQSPYFTLQTQDVSRIDFSELPTYSVIILDGLQTISGGLAQVLQTVIQSGKTVVCIPSARSNIDSYNSFFSKFGNQQFSKLDSTKTIANKVDFNHILYKHVFSKTDKNTEYPTIFKHFPFTPIQHYTIIGLQNNNPLLTHIRFGKGSLFICSSPLTPQSNTFISHPLFVGLYTIGLYVANHLELYRYIGEPISIEAPINITEPIIHIQNKQKQVDFIPHISQITQSSIIRLNPMQGIQQAGQYSVINNEKVIANIAYNYSRKESQSDFYTVQDLEQIIESRQLQNTHIIPLETKTISETVNDVRLGTLLWRWFIIFAIMFACTEVLIIRYFK